MAQVHEASVERLRFEYDARQRAILILETRMNRLAHYYELLERERRELEASDSYESSKLAGNYIKFQSHCNEQQETAKFAALDAEKEMAEIYRVLSAKWR
jgi:hypothetical protein